MKYKSNLFFAFVLTCSLAPDTHACFILFMSDGREVLVGNHEDWFSRNPGIAINPPNSKRFGSVIFTFMDEGWAQGGMNEHGLFFDAARTPFQQAEFDNQLPLFFGYIWQELLDKCRDVDEAIAFIQKYNLPELSEVHFLIADASGNA